MVTNGCKVVENKRPAFLLFQHRETTGCPLSAFVPSVCLFESTVGTLRLFVSCADHTSQHSSTQENSHFQKFTLFPPQGKWMARMQRTLTMDMVPVPDPNLQLDFLGYIRNLTTNSSVKVSVPTFSHRQ